MAMSAEALAGLRTVAAWNPAGARMLLAILRERPAWVKRKDDPYGPLHLIQHAVQATTTTPDGRIVAARRSPFPLAQAATFERFGEEWRRGEIGVGELAEALDGILTGLDGDGAGEIG